MKLKKIINLFGGPGIGKSTVCSGLFYQMKTNGFNCEHATEYAKDLVYDKRFNILDNDQLYIFAKQHRKIFKMIDHVKYIVTDSPLLLSAFYISNNIYDKDLLIKLIIATHIKYNNLNIMLTRNPDFEYEESGRLQSASEVIKVDEDLIKFLIFYCIPFVKIKVNENTLRKIMELI